MIAQSRPKNGINLKIAIKKNRSEPDSTFRQSKDASGSLSVCGEIGQRGIEEAPGSLNRAGFRAPEIRDYLDSVAFCLSFGCSWIKERQAMKPVRGRETLFLENGDAEGNVGIT